MTIMLASAFAVGAPSVLPNAAAANANLFVSAENSQFQNYVSGPQVTEVVIIDSDIKDTDKGKGEPDVTVNGKHLRMAQATDGNWYGYFADRTMAQTADSLQIGNHNQGTGLDFGTFCNKDATFLGPSFSETAGFAVARAANGGVQGKTDITSANCVSGNANSSEQNVVRQNKTLNTESPQYGQIGFTSDGSYEWPVIQLYNFNPTGNIVVQYNKGGGVQSTTLKFDTVDQFAKLEMDRTNYPQGAQVDLTMTNPIMNIDPTDEDSWTFGTSATNKTLYYGIFTNDGALAANNFTKSLTGNTTALMFNHNDFLSLKRDANGVNIVNLQDNADTALNATLAIDAGKSVIYSGSQPVTFTETAPNTGVFGTYDESDKSVLVVADNAQRGKSASLDFNQKSSSILVGFGSASVSIQPTDAEWNSGEKIPITLVDTDQNKNSRADEDLRLNYNSTTLIPSLRIGTPFTLGANGTGILSTVRAITTDSISIIGNHSTGSTGGNLTAYLNTGAKMARHDVTVSKYSDIAVVSGRTGTGIKALAISYGKTAGDLQKTVYDTRTTNDPSPRLHGFDYFNYDIRSLSDDLGTSSVDTYFAYSNKTNLADGQLLSNTITNQQFRVASMSNNTSGQGLVNLNNTKMVEALYNLTSTSTL